MLDPVHATLCLLVFVVNTCLAVKSARLRIQIDRFNAETTEILSRHRAAQPWESTDA